MRLLKGLLIGGLFAVVAACGGASKPPVASNPAAPPKPVAQAPAGQSASRPAQQPGAVPTLPPAPVSVRPPAGLTKPTPVTDTQSVSLWTDQFLFGGWRIQRHFYSGQSRLVDPRNMVRALGSYDVTKAAFDWLRVTERVTPRSKRLALLLHGLGSSPQVMVSLERVLEQDGFDAMTVTYPTTEQGVSAHADGVEQLLKNLQDYDEVVIVAHSLGGLITRATLSRPSFTNLRVPVRAVVMIGTPNQGATLAEMLRPLARMAATASANDLLPARARQIGPIPRGLRFGVIAGGRGTTSGYNPILRGDNDGVVLVTETRAANMTDFIRLPVMHNAMTTDPDVILAVRAFLRTGRFRPQPVS
jgi:pimeloyl-ACP methyl ester carboxylesterase